MVIFELELYYREDWVCQEWPAAEGEQGAPWSELNSGALSAVLAGQLLKAQLQF